MLSSYIYLYILILTTLITIDICAYEVESLEDISQNLEMKFNSIPAFDIGDIKLWDDLDITILNVRISIFYLGDKEIIDWKRSITYYDFYINFIYDMKFKQFADNIRGRFVNEIAYMKEKCTAFIYYKMFNIRKMFGDEDSLEIDIDFSHKEEIVVSDMNDYFFYSEFVGNGGAYGLIKKKLFEVYVKKFEEILLYYPRCRYLVMFDKINVILKRNIEVNYDIKDEDCEVFREIKFKKVEYETIIKKAGVALNITKVNYNVAYKTSTHNRDSTTYFPSIEIRYGKEIVFEDVFPKIEQYRCINIAVVRLIKNAFDKVYNS